MSTAAVQSSRNVAPPSRSLATLRRLVVNYLGGGSDPEFLQMAEDSINLAIDQLNMMSWLKITGYSDITVSADTSDYAVPADYKHPLKLQTRNSDVEPLGAIEWLDPKTFMDRFPKSVSSGTPTHYTVISQLTSNQLTLNRAPSSDWVSVHPYLRLHYFRRIAYLSTRGSYVLNAPPEFGAFVVHRARAELASMKGDRMKENDALAKAEHVRMLLRAEDNNTGTDF